MNARWVSWEQPYFAPVDGTVVAAKGDMPDSQGMNLVSDADDAVGNHVIIETDSGHFVVLAHLRENSVQVEEGDEVMAGQPIANCGNSGNTTSPHLHIQVQTHADLWHADNRSVPFAFEDGGRALGRNARVRGRVPALVNE